MISPPQPLRFRRIQTAPSSTLTGQRGRGGSNIRARLITGGTGQSLEDKTPRTNYLQRILMQRISGDTTRLIFVTTLAPVIQRVTTEG